MKLFLIILTLFSSTASFALQSPNVTLTPGRVDNKVTKDLLCSPGYVESHSVIPADVQAKVLKRYGLQPSASLGIDNLVSVELGGSQTDVRNLWPQDVCPTQWAGTTCYGLHEKDAVEASLHQRVCSGQLSLASAQQIVRSGKWIEEYKHLQLASQQAALPANPAPVSYPLPGQPQYPTQAPANYQH